MPAILPHDDLAAFSSIYFSLRQKEKRAYTDAEVLLLPAIDPSHPMNKEWLIRKQSCDKLIRWFGIKKGPLRILEVGCGNGWLCHQMASLPGVQVTGIDINQEELQQAQRVFAGNDRLQFIYGDLKSAVVTGHQFDAIVLAASIQYFPSVPRLLMELMQLLDRNGEIHVLDSPFYQAGETASAKERSKQYYQDIGFPEMNQYYFHHEMAALAGFNYRVLYRASFIQTLVRRNGNPFPWIVIKK